MVTVIVTAATAVIVSGCYRDEKLGTTPNHTERDTVCHQHLWHCVPYIYSATETSFNTSGHSGDGMMLGTTSTQGDAGETQEKALNEKKFLQERRNRCSHAPSRLHECSMAAPWPVPRCAPSPSRDIPIWGSKPVSGCVSVPHILQRISLAQKGFARGRGAE